MIISKLKNPVDFNDFKEALKQIEYTEIDKQTFEALNYSEYLDDIFRADDDDNLYYASFSDDEEGVMITFILKEEKVNMKEEFISKTMKDIEKNLAKYHKHGYSKNDLFYFTIGMVSGALNTLSITDRDLFLEVTYSDLADRATEYLESLYR